MNPYVYIMFPESVQSLKRFSYTERKKNTMPQGFNIDTIDLPAAATDRKTLGYDAPGGRPPGASWRNLAQTL